MTRIDLVLAILAILLVAMLAGWTLHWLWARLSHSDDAEHLHEMAERLHDAEMARDTAERKRREAEEAARVALAERQAELDGAMETIGSLRRQLAEWQAAYDALQGSGSGSDPGSDAESGSGSGGGDDPQRSA